MMLTPAQQHALHAVLNRVIPADEFPSATEAGVLDYLRGQFARDLRPLFPLYAAGLDGLDAEAVLRFGRVFAALPDAEQDALCAQVADGETRAAWRVEPEAFFRALCEHAAEGYYAEPAQGGNRGGRSWEMLGFAPQLRGETP